MIRFTLAPVPRRKAEGYFVVTILPDMPSFQKYLKARGSRFQRGTIAVHLARRDSDAPRGFDVWAYLGELVFWQTTLKMRGVTLLSHELTHAVLAWARQKKILGKLTGPQPSDGGFLSRRSPEERICHAMSAMTQQFVREGYKQGIWP